MSKIPYYYRQRWGVGTNLQLHSLRQAWRLWKNLQPKKDFLRSSRITERCVVIIDLLGLSISQLLGQNLSSSLKRRVPSLINLWNSFLGMDRLPKEKKKKIDNRFQEFSAFYDDCRHFGVSKHDKMDKLTFEAPAGYVELSLDIWDAVCDYFKASDHAALQFRSVRDILDEDEDQENEDEW